MKSQDFSEFVVDEKLLKLFFTTMEQRQLMWYNRHILKLDYPWGNDKILNEYRFTNVYRELDRNSQFEIKLINDDFFNFNTIIWNILIFRTFNSPEFFDFVEKNTDWKFGIIPHDNIEKDKLKLFKLASEARKQGINPFTNAYLTNTMSCVGFSRDYCVIIKRLPQLVKLFEILINYLIKEKDYRYRVAEIYNVDNLIDFFKTVDGVSDFMAHELFVSMTYINKYSRYVFPFNENDFTNTLVGSTEGLKLIFNFKDFKKQTNLHPKQLIYFLRDISEKFLSKDFKYIQFDRISKQYQLCEHNISLHQIEMWLCEFQKYIKVRDGYGKQRQRYNKH